MTGKTLSEEKARQLVLDTLAAAQEAQGMPVTAYEKYGGRGGGHHHHDMKSLLLVYLAAALVGLVAFYLLKMYAPSFVTVKSADGPVFDTTRGAVAATIVALLVLLLYHALC